MKWFAINIDIRRLRVTKNKLHKTKHKNTKQQKTKRVKYIELVVVVVVKYICDRSTLKWSEYRPSKWVSGATLPQSLTYIVVYYYYYYLVFCSNNNQPKVNNNNNKMFSSRTTTTTTDRPKRSQTKIQQNKTKKAEPYNKYTSHSIDSMHNTTRLQQQRLKNK